MLKFRGLSRPFTSGLVAVGALLTAQVTNASPVAPNAVADWNEIAMSAITAQRPGPQGMLDVALVHIAVHDAVQSIEQRFEPYNVEIKGAKGSRTAAHPTGR